MPTINWSKRKTHGYIDAGFNVPVRAVDFVINLATDATMTAATDDIALATLPEGTIVVGATIEQIAVGTGTGTLALRTGTTALTGTLASTATVGTRASATAAALPRVVPQGGEELNLLGATATRLDGIIRVVVLIAEGFRAPKMASLAPRDAITGLA